MRSRRDGKGRPQKIYALRSNIDEIIGYYEAEKSQEAAQTMGGHPEAEGAKLGIISEGDLPLQRFLRQQSYQEPALNLLAEHLLNQSAKDWTSHINHFS